MCHSMPLHFETCWSSWRQSSGTLPFDELTCSFLIMADLGMSKTGRTELPARGISGRTHCRPQNVGIKLLARTACQSVSAMYNRTGVEITLFTVSEQLDLDSGAVQLKTDIVFICMEDIRNKAEALNLGPCKVQTAQSKSDTTLAGAMAIRVCAGPSHSCNLQSSP